VAAAKAFFKKVTGMKGGRPIPSSSMAMPHLIERSMKCKAMGLLLTGTKLRSSKYQNTLIE
jgi:hypothetical protein